MIALLFLTNLAFADVGQIPREIDCDFTIKEIRKVEDCVFQKRHKMWQSANEKYPEVMFFHPILEPSINRLMSEIGHAFCMDGNITLPESEYRRYQMEVEGVKECRLKQ